MSLRLAVTAGEPAGVGPELCLRLAERDWPWEPVVVADRALLEARARALGWDVALTEADLAAPPRPARAGRLAVLHVPAPGTATPGRPDPALAPYVVETVRRAVRGCLAGRFAALVTAPVHKGVINDAGIPFSGHTELVAAECGAAQPVMMLVAQRLRVALVTTHLPLRAVPEAVRRERVEAVLAVLEHDLRHRFRIPRPRILVCGLNPHAGEGGHLGREEIEHIAPAVAKARAGGADVIGPLPADTAFTPARLAGADAVLAMYHDQGLPVLKHRGFGRAVNVTLGLPIVRTSVDHGTALELAGTGRADPGSLHEALRLAATLAGAP
ncbi:4-hydroxythreonine-4-phosphate dehydrogenase PdxA [Inmirania thermothiophila]|uniref:4-hydroxythreonine-4-phosphate dehydrogenase n=1 Tax=Inmirania thermothiophila TaxID=1750597 RepID=A0A3N1Y7D6_9GAMM|nr:4-hydroxythreonine-4-phosphate dehydrogenase PdxA [Inmirania thermothiophila]ROR34670.1 4-hydroxythreonine-4-phosphate dehydrogenase [Inmirania thermothiophila]